jgi:hypothetical protein
MKQYKEYRKMMLRLRVLFSGKILPYNFIIEFRRCIGIGEKTLMFEMPKQIFKWTRQIDPETKLYRYFASNKVLSRMQIFIGCPSNLTHRYDNYRQNIILIQSIENLMKRWWILNYSKQSRERYWTCEHMMPAIVSDYGYMSEHYIE